MVKRLFHSLLWAAMLGGTTTVQAKQPSKVIPSGKKTTSLGSPAAISGKLKAALKKTKNAAVSVFAGGYASGVIISEDGYVLTAAHVLKLSKDRKKDVTITLDNGKTFQAISLGYNIESDFGLLKIKDLKGEKIPFCKIARSSPATGDFVFTYSHPSGILKGRPAQTRLGRVTSVRSNEGKPIFLYSDLNIQPGDSGGPLYNLDGELVGINSSAALQIEFNIFSAIEQFHLDQERLKKNERWGDNNKSPTNAEMLKAKFDKATVAKVQAELLKRAKAHHYKTTDFVRRYVNDKGEAKINAQQMVNFMVKDAISIANGQQVSLGLDDPEIIKKLKVYKKRPDGFIPFHISDGSKTITKATSIGNGLLVAKASLLSGIKSPHLLANKQHHALSVIEKSKELDLILLKVGKNVKIPHILFPKRKITIEAGDGLTAPDRYGRPLWNVATDSRREVKKKRSVGPLQDKSVISQHRAPYPEAIRHSVPLFAKEAGTPVFDLEGNFVGIHIARFSRTMGLIIPHEHIQTFAEKHLNLKK